MRMAVNKAGRQRQVAGIDRGIGLLVAAIAEIDDAIAIDRNIDES